MARAIYVFIYLPGEERAVPAGIFEHDDASMSGSFQYGKQYQTRPEAVAVDPVSLPLGKPLYPDALLHGGLYGAFRDASPDFWGRQVYARQRRVPPESLTEIDFMLAANATRVGNLDFREALDSPEPAYAPPEFAELGALLEAARAVDEDRALSEEQHALVDLLVQGSSIGGARPKATVLYNDELWVAKFPETRDRFSQARVELATMTLAGLCGIHVPEMLVTDVNGRDVLLSRRFDRQPSPQGMLRHGYISALTLLNVSDRDFNQWSYPRLADAMRTLTAPETLAEMYDRMVFNILVRNTDDHPRNHGFINVDGTWKLSPAFDIVPSRTTLGTGTNFHLAMTVGAAGKEGSIANALSNCERFGLASEEARERIHAMCSVVAGWRQVFADCGVSEKETEMFAWGLEHEESPLKAGLRLEPVAENGESPRP